jgi:hypothetical protein
MALLRYWVYDHTVVMTSRIDHVEECVEHAPTCLQAEEARATSRVEGEKTQEKQKKQEGEKGEKG